MSPATKVGCPSGPHHLPARHRTEDPPPLGPGRCWDPGHQDHRMDLSVHIRTGRCLTSSWRPASSNVALLPVRRCRRIRVYARRLSRNTNPNKTTGRPSAGTTIPRHATEELNPYGPRWLKGRVSVGRRRATGANQSKWLHPLWRLPGLGEEADGDPRILAFFSREPSARTQADEADAAHAGDVGRHLDQPVLVIHP